MANKQDDDNHKRGQRLLKLGSERESLLAALPGGVPQSAADRARWELVRYVNKLTQKKIAAKI
ncbi:MAG: hypothetical protein OHK0011_00720 [Turneriella sp.]